MNFVTFTVCMPDGASPATWIKVVALDQVAELSESTGSAIMAAYSTHANKCSLRLKNGDTFVVAGTIQDLLATLQGE